jgi:hypothetical protein
MAGLVDRVDIVDTTIGPRQAAGPTGYMGGDDTPDRRRYHRTMPDDEDKDARLSADRMSRLAYRAILFIVCAACSGAVSRPGSRTAQLGA